MLHHRYVPVATRISDQQAAVSTTRSPTVPPVSVPWRMTRVLRSGDMGGMTDMTGAPGCAR
ncbi:hypothetical protein GCM10020001_075290 [Nonomuraea salmonea]